MLVITHRECAILFRCDSEEDSVLPSLTRFLFHVISFPFILLPLCAFHLRIEISSFVLHFADSTWKNTALPAFPGEVRNLSPFGIALYDHSVAAHKSECFPIAPLRRGCYIQWCCHIQGFSSEPSWSHGNGDQRKEQGNKEFSQFTAFNNRIYKRRWWIWYHWLPHYGRCVSEVSKATHRFCAFLLDDCDA